MTGGRFRLDRGGAVDRSRPLRFTFDGRGYEGLAGDTLASALLANGVRLVARSFKYHRPRGIYTAGPEEPNALVQLGTGARTEPNARATTVELHDGLVAESQNRWPSLRWDAGAVNDRLGRFLPAGFYYKTFMWPGRSWMRYERAIRAMAGLGRAPTGADPDRYEHVHAHCDVLVAGGGPAGLAAAQAAASAGARVILADEGTAFGGALLDEGTEDYPGGVRLRVDGRPAGEWVAGAVRGLLAQGEVRLLARTTVFGFHDHMYPTLLQRLEGPGEAGDGAGAARQRLWKVRAKAVVLATGAIERPIVFPGNDRPGVMLAGAVRRYLNRYAARPGERAVVFTSNDGAYRTALALHAAGVAVPAVVDLRPGGGGALAAAAEQAGIVVRSGAAVVATRGRSRLRGVAVATLDPTGERVVGPEERIACDTLAVSGGWNPAVHLFSQSRGRLRWRADDAVFVPGAPAQPVWCAGACKGDLTLSEAIEGGYVAGSRAAAASGFPGSVPRAPSVTEPAQAASRVLWQVPPGRAGGKAFVDLQNDVTADDLALAVREGFRSIEHVKRYTTAGMGTDQGKLGNVHALAIVGQALGIVPDAVGTTTFRPPYTPVTFGAFAGRNKDALFDPVRRTPMHGWHEAAGAVFEDVGQWKRAWYYPRAGEDMAGAVRREVMAARAGVGILDYSTLGKIDVRGPDAAAFLDRVYTNSFSTLGIGRCRYGLMLREDGMVMDDGVTARLADDRFLMTTTTGNAATVLGWLEEWLQTEWTDLRVHCTSVTEHYAVASVCGPQARALLAKVADGMPLDDEAFPHMSTRAGTVAGIRARMQRVSFIGETGFEIAVGASHGLALWEALLTAGAPFGITPYGTEAMHVLRAEKGFIIVGQDTDGTVTPDDLGMGWIVGRKKADFLGKRSLARSDTARAGRKQLVGLLTEDPAVVLPEGAPVVAALSPPRPAPGSTPMLGHVTSSYDSPNVGRSIALALVRGGRDRMGQRLFVPLGDRAVAVEVVRPLFFDPDGSRLHG